MLTINEAGEWVVTIGRYRRRTLAWVIQHDSYWLISWALCTAGVTEVEAAIVDAALKEREDALNAIQRKTPLAEVK